MNDPMEISKAAGDAAVRAGDFKAAVAHYTEAIRLAPANHVLYSNRSAAYASDSNYQSAITDAEKTIELKPDWPRGYSRKGLAQYRMGNLLGAMQTYSEGMTRCPGDVSLQKSFEEIITSQQDQCESFAVSLFPSQNLLFSWDSTTHHIIN